MFLNDILLRPDVQVIRNRVSKLIKVSLDRDACWPWQARTRKGYGEFEVHPENKRLLAHRLAYVLHYGPIPEYLNGERTCVLHRCDNPPCCNPNHLFLGSNLDNIDDMIAKGRVARGAKSGRAKLTDAQISVIRTADRSVGSLANEFGVSQGAVRAALDGITWAHLPSAPTDRVCGARKGERSINAKLTEVQVLAIRIDPRPHRVVAFEYSVHPKTVSAIKRRLKWKHLP